MNRSKYMMNLVEDFQSVRSMLAHLTDKLTAELEFRDKDALERWIWTEVARLTPAELNRLDITHIEDREYPEIADKLWDRYQELFHPARDEDQLEEIASLLYDYMETEHMQSVQRIERQIAEVTADISYHQNRNLHNALRGFDEIRTDEHGRIAQEIHRIQGREDSIRFPNDMGTQVVETVAGIRHPRSDSPVVDFVHDHFGGHLRPHVRDMLNEIIEGLRSYVDDNS